MRPTLQATPESCSLLTQRAAGVGGRPHHRTPRRRRRNWRLQGQMMSDQEKGSVFNVTGPWYGPSSDSSASCDRQMMLLDVYAVNLTHDNVAGLSQRG
jgi:hypothetical protein